MKFLDIDIKKCLYKDKNRNFKINEILFFKNIKIKDGYVKQTDNGIYIFISGKWKYLNDEQFFKIINHYLRKLVYNEAKEYILIPSKIIREIYQICLVTADKFPETGDIINIVADGYYKVITETKIYKIEPVSGNVIIEKNEGQYYNFACIKDFDIDKKIEFTPIIKKFFNNITNKNKNYLEYLQELAGSCLLNQTAPEPYIYILYGGGKNGKSAFNRLLSYIVFHQTSAVEFANINEQNAALFASKYINMPTEITDKTFNSAILKAITSGDPISVNEKYKDPRKIIPISKQIASTNKLPALADSSYGMWRRLQILPFDFKITHANKIDENILYKEFRENTEILRIWAFKGLIRFIKNDGIHTKVKDIIEATNNYKLEENNVYQFLNEFRQFIIKNNYDIKNSETVLFLNDFYINTKKVFKYEKGETYDPKIVLKELYQIYKNWASNQGYKPLSIKNFKFKIKEEYIPNIDIDEYAHQFAVKFIVFNEIERIHKTKENERMKKDESYKEKKEYTENFIKNDKNKIIEKLKESVKKNITKNQFFDKNIEELLTKINIKNINFEKIDKDIFIEILENETGLKYGGAVDIPF